MDVTAKKCTSHTETQQQTDNPLPSIIPL